MVSHDEDTVTVEDNNPADIILNPKLDPGFFPQ